MKERKLATLEETIIKVLQMANELEMPKEELIELINLLNEEDLK